MIKLDHKLRRNKNFLKVGKNTNLFRTPNKTAR